MKAAVLNLYPLNYPGYGVLMRTTTEASKQSKLHGVCVPVLISILRLI